MENKAFEEVDEDIEEDKSEENKGERQAMGITIIKSADKFFQFP